MSFSIERYHDFSCGHRVHGHESKCAHLHGHNYRVFFTCAAAPPAKPARNFIGQRDMVSPELDAIGRVVDFSVVKETLCEFLEQYWDHKMLLWEEDPMLPLLAQADPDGVVPVPFNPTAENMAAFLVNTIGPRVLHGAGVVLVQCRVEETRKCAATYTRGEGA